MKCLIATVALATILGVNVFGQVTIAARAAGSHIGQTVTICDKVYDGKALPAESATVLYLGGYYPHQLLTVIIKNADRKKFKGRPDVDDKGKDFTVTGKLISYNGKPAIVATGPAQLKPVL